MHFPKGSAIFIAFFRSAGVKEQDEYKNIN